MTSAEGKDDVTHRDFMLVFERTINEVKAEMKRQGREDEFIGAKVGAYVLTCRPFRLTSLLVDLYHHSIHHTRGVGVVS